MTKVLDKQNIYDLLLQESGGLNNTARVLRDNGLNFNDSLVPGDEVEVAEVEAERVKNNYELIRFKPNNGGEKPLKGKWILKKGVWDDGGIWIDTELWKDS